MATNEKNTTTFEKEFEKAFHEMEADDFFEKKFLELKAEDAKKRKSAPPKKSIWDGLFKRKANTPPPQKDVYHVATATNASQVSKATDDCIIKTMDFINTIHSYRTDSLDCPVFIVGFTDVSITLYFFDSDHSSTCIYMNMIHRKQAEEDEINCLIGKEIHADELPKETTMEWHFDDTKDEYDYYVLRHTIPTERKKKKSYYLNCVKELCEKKHLSFEQRGDSLHFNLK